MIYGLLQARTDSTRLPKKVLKQILNQPMILHQLERTSKSKLIDKLILVTSDESNDDVLSKIVLDNSYNLFRGSKDNVLKRFFDAIPKAEDNDIIVRLTGDCPLHDANIIDETIAELKDNDYISNSVLPIYPDGFDVEVFKYSALKDAYINAKLKSELEHVTPYIRNSGKFQVVNLNKTPIHSKWRLTVDELDDFDVVKNIFEHFGNNKFSFIDIVKFLEQNLHILNKNSHINRNEGYLKSLKEDHHNGSRW
jgi:spore coat polysaccharide biosynthesis protein SpsF (cytidylyltransferase family)